jgi:hypothetical protein
MDIKFVGKSWGTVEESFWWWDVLNMGWCGLYREAKGWHKRANIYKKYL